MSNISSLCYNPTPQNGATTEINFPIADAEIRKAIYTDSLKTYIGLPATPAISIDSSNNNNTLSFWPSNNNTQVPLILQGNDSPLIPNDSTIKIIGQRTDSFYYLVINNDLDDFSNNDMLRFWDDSSSSSRNLRLSTQRKINGGVTYANYVTFSIGADGTRNIEVSDPAAWRKAFEIKDLGLVETVPGDTKSIPNRTTTNLCSKTFSAGTWLIHCTANFPSNTTGGRGVWLATSATGTNNSIYTGAYERSNSAGNSIINFTTVQWFTASTTRYLNVFQNSGIAQNVYGGMKAVKICDFVA